MNNKYRVVVITFLNIILFITYIYSALNSQKYKEVSIGAPGTLNGLELITDYNIVYYHANIDMELGTMEELDYSMPEDIVGWPADYDDAVVISENSEIVTTEFYNTLEHVEGSYSKYRYKYFLTIQAVGIGETDVYLMSPDKKVKYYSIHIVVSK